MWAECAGQVVLVTGGTRGIGRAIATAFCRAGASVIVTSKWGSVPGDTWVQEFTSAGLEPPLMIDADARASEDTVRTMHTIRARYPSLDVLVSNVAFAPAVSSLDEYNRRDMLTGIEYSAWPLVDYTREAARCFGRAPRYVIGLSSEGATTLHYRYDMVAVAKAALETLARYLHQRLRDGGTRVNIVRTRYVDTESLRDAFSDTFIPFVAEHAPGIITTPDQVANAVLALCSGWLDGLGGQIVRADNGAHVFDNFSRLFTLQQTTRP